MVSVVRSWPREAQAAWATSLLVVGGLFTVALVSLLADPALEPLTRWALEVCAVTSGAAFIDAQSQELLQRPTSRPRSSLTALLLVLSSAVLLVVAGSWSLLGLCAAWALLRMRTAPALAVLGVGAAVVVALVLRLSGLGVAMAVFTAGQALLSGVVLHTLTRLCAVLLELRATRAHLARVEVERERARMSRDLHDVIGRTLVAVALRSETALRLLGTDPAACGEQLVQTRVAVRSGQAQLRALTSGPVEVTTAAELRAAQVLMAHAGIRCDMDLAPVPPELDALLGFVVREAVTNMLKHSRARRCRIELRLESGGAVLVIVNDGCPWGVRSPTRSPGASQTGEPPGTGLTAVRNRVAEVGGLLEAGPVAGGRFRIIARLPLPATPPQRTAVDGAVRAAVGLP